MQRSLRTRHSARATQVYQGNRGNSQTTPADCATLVKSELLAVELCQTRLKCKMTSPQRAPDSRAAAVRASHCRAELARPAPRTVVACEGACAGVGWRLGEWGACSLTCGGGTQHRGARCEDSQTGELHKADRCGAGRGNVTRPCNIEVMVEKSMLQII